MIDVRFLFPVHFQWLRMWCMKRVETPATRATGFRNRIDFTNPHESELIIGVEVQLLRNPSAGFLPPLLLFIVIRLRSLLLVFEPDGILCLGSKKCMIVPWNFLEMSNYVRRMCFIFSISIRYYLIKTIIIYQEFISLISTYLCRFIVGAQRALARGPKTPKRTDPDPIKKLIFRR